MHDLSVDAYCLNPVKRFKCNKGVSCVVNLIHVESVMLHRSNMNVLGIRCCWLSSKSC
jgi:hypothetical protein